MMNLRATYLLILNRRITDFFRSRGRRREDYVDELPEQGAPEADDEGPSDDALDVASLLHVLNPRQQHVMQLKYFQELTTSQIAERLGISEGNVCSDLFYGRKKLLAALEAKKQARRSNQP